MKNLHLKTSGFIKAASALLLIFFAGMTAQAQQNIYMHTGSRTLVGNETVNFYDSGGESSGPAYYWERWFSRGEDYTFTFKPATGKKIKVTFKQFTAYTDNNEHNPAHAFYDHPQWALRVNNGELSIYNGLEVNEANLITTYTGSVIDEFTVIADGAMTFHFVSGYREEGWEAEVTQVDAYTVQKPSISFEVCDDQVVLNANNPRAKIYYTTDGTDPSVPTKDPLSAGILYEGPFPVAVGTEIRAIACDTTLTTNNTSGVAKLTYTSADVTPTPGKPSITRTGNTITMEPAPLIGDINETYTVYYKTEAEGAYTEYTAPIEWNTPHTTFYAITKPVSCSDKISADTTLYFDKVQVPDPTIEFTDVNTTTGIGTVKITCASGYVISYTTDGSDPTTTGGVASPVTLADINPGTTIKAIAYKDGNTTDYQPSNIVTLLCIPGGDGQSGAYGTVVLLDDREDHSWSYYSDKDQPIRSLNPVDVKITYFGNGTNTVSTSSNANPGNTFTASTYDNNNPTVQVSYNETENTFIYLETLERADGATSNNPTGNCAYTTIPNPFSKRPTYGTSNTTKWRGFYAWRVKAVRGGSIQNHAVGSTIDAETEVTFVPDGEYGMEVELEALWARAYVIAYNASYLDANGYLNSTSLEADTYERNFYVITGGNSDAAINRSGQKPVTISNRYPDGTTGGSLTSRIQNTVTCNNDTKFEYVVFRGGNSYCASISGNGNDLVIGRGVTGYNNGICATSVYGKNGTGTTISSFNLRVESGSFTNSYLFNGNSEVTSEFTVNATYGNDYDRANSNTNTNLTIAGPVEVALNTKCSNANSKIYVRTLSGTFGTNANNNEFYLGFENVGTTNSRAYRSLEVLGGNFLGGISGGIEYGVAATTEILKMRIKGGTIHQYLYGSGQYSAAYGSRKTIITGGTFDSWVAGGCYGTDTDGQAGTTNGDSYIYFGGKATQSNTEGVFGGGYGRGDAGDNKYTINKSFVVVADEAQVAGNVYGGGNKGYNTDDAEVWVLGGGKNTITVAGSVFGGANQARSEAKTTVTMKDGTVTGSLYGGANTSGTVAGLATVNMNGGKVANVYGGGLGASTNMASGTVVNVSNGTINNNVYGGGQLGTVDGNTNVTVSGGTMKNVYGAGKGGNTTAQISGQTFVTVTGGTISESVYGGGENGDVMNSAGGSGSGGETITLNQNVNQAIEAGKTYNFYDSGGANGNYGNSQNYTATFTYNGDITISFTSFATESASGCSDWDYMLIYDGTSSGTQIARGQTDCASANISSGSSFTATSGTMTIVWKSDGSYNAAGWAATITGSGGGQTENLVASTVTVTGGSITGDVFGGGRMGKTDGNTEVDIEGGNVRGNVFGGAYGSSGSIFVAGMHTVNIMGGRVFGNVYGGSRNANDALVFNNPDANETATNAVVNISAGQIDQQVYAAGYFGQTYGSVYAFVGKNAILNAPNNAPSFGDNNETKYHAGNLRIADNIWAGGDWGVFESGSFGAPTVSGYSNIYVDGTGYNTETTSESAPTYMNIGGSLLGCGTSCDAGKQGRTIMVRNYGKALESGSKDNNFPEPYTEATRTLYSIQRADTLIIDNSHINFTGLAQVNSIEATAKYAIYSFDKTVRIVGGSSLFMNAMTSQIIDFWSASCTDVYAKNATYTPVAYNAVSGTPNKIRVNGGNYIEIYHDKMPMQENGSTVYKPGYGMLNGFAYMMVAESTSDNTCAYARPKQCQDTPINSNLNNENDGGWVSYDSEKNTYDINGNSHAETGVTLGALVQMPYENHVNQTKNGEQYFRIWRAGGVYSEREAVVNILADGTDSFGCVAVSVKLPAWKTANSYYKFQTTGDAPALNTTVDYGADLNVYNSALTDTTSNTSWIHYTPGEGGTIGQQDSGSLEAELGYIRENPNVSYGLVTAAGLAMSGNPLIVCGESDPFLAQVTGTDPNWQTVNKFTCGDFEKNPEVTFMVTYSNLISTNMTWDPMYVTLVQMDENGNEIDIVKIAIVINTATTIDREFTTQVYAVMNETGSPNDSYIAKVVLPTFDLFDPTAAHNSQFTVTNVSFEGTASDATDQSWQYKGSTLGAVNKFAMEVGGSTNEDNTDGWNGTSIGVVDSKTAAPSTILGEASGRLPFAIDFRLTYDGTQKYVGGDEDAKLGVLTFKLTYDNVPVEGPNNTTISGSKTLIIHVEIIRRGTGNAFYLDGQNGSNGYEGTYPDRAVLSLSTIYNRLGFMPGDIVYVVNTVDVTNELEWIGTRYDHVDIYRYPGGHTLKGDSITGNPDNKAFKGQLLNVKSKGKMNVRDITLDGHNDAHHRPGTSNDKATDAAVTADAPLITVASGGILTLTAGAKLQNNTSTTDGGAVKVEDGGTLKMNGDATIRYNEIQGQAINGGAVFMAGTMIASDSIQIDTNYKASALNNLFLASKDKMLTIGTPETTDDFDMLASSAHIGITKTESDDDGWYRVVNVTEDADIPWLEIPYAPRPNDIIFHDGGIYQLEKHTSPQILYWVGTWVTRQYWNPEFTSDTVTGYNTNMDYSNIDTREKLAWLISMVNGANGCEPNNFSGKTVNITADIDMSDDIWVPIGTTAHPFKGTFEGNGHVINGVRTPLVNTNVGMMGYTEGATISDAVVNVNFTGNSVNQGTVIGTMKGGTLSNVEAAGNLNGLDNTINMGGLVGVVQSGTIHSSFAVNTMSATVDTTVMGGLVGVNGGNLYNSYANVSVANTNASTRLGGLVGVNNANCIVENCYVINPIGPAFAYDNQGKINYCYAADGTTTFVGNSEGGTLTGTGTYAPVMGRKELGYMYGDNKVTAPAANTYAKDTVKYENDHTVVWNGLLSVLNQWVKDGHTSYSTWNRPTTMDINGDLPILAFPKDNCLGTSNGKFLVYSASDEIVNDKQTNNGLDNLLGKIYNGQTANIYLYKSATGVVNGTGNNKLFIHEDAALLQASSSKATIDATVGITFDNSCKSAVSTGDPSMPLNYDWHLMSTPLANAPMGISWSEEQVNWWNTQDWNDAIGQVTGVSGSYLPNGMDAVSHWDFYTYYEPEYHWINFKRNSSSHAHYEEPHGWITYDNETNLIAGRGYMAAIDQDSYLSNNGTLNNDKVEIKLTNSDDETGHEEPTKDWGSNLIGNPYQAYLDLAKVSDSTGYTKFYIYSAETNQYVPFTKGQSTNSWTPSQYIHPHQAFFVLNGAASETFTFTYGMATATKDEGSYLRKGAQIDYPLINLFVKNEVGASNYTIIEVGRPELGGAERTKALKTTDFDLYSHYGQNDYKLLFTPEEAQRVAVFFDTKDDGKYTLTWDTQNGEFSFLRLIDNITGVEVDMLRNDHYTFEGHATDYASRFYILFNNPNEEPGGNGNGNGNGFAYNDGYGWIVNGEGILKLVDVTGRVLYQEYLAGDMNRVHLDNFKAGVYVLQLGDKAQKIVIK